jgi:hypothetical protein
VLKLTDRDGAIPRPDPISHAEGCFVKRLLSLGLCSVILITTATLANALTIEQVTPGDPGGTTNPIGQSLRTPATGGPWDNLTFNFFNGDPYPPYAFGDLYLLDQQYLGTAAGLSTATPGYVAHTGNIVAEGAGSEWVFATTVQLEQDTDYWFYMSGVAGGVLLEFEMGNPLASGDFYFTNPSPPDPYAFTTSHDAAFELEGTPTVPEPSSWALASLGLLTLSILRRTR